MVLDGQPPSTAYVLVAVTPADFVFVNEGGPHDEEMPEAGTVRPDRREGRFDVAGVGGNHVSGAGRRVVG